MDENQQASQQNENESQLNESQLNESQLNESKLNESNLNQPKEIGAKQGQQYGQNPYYQSNASMNYQNGQYQNQQFYYNQNPNQRGVYQPELEEPVSLLDWVGTLLLLLIPCVAQIIYIIWAFSKDTKKSKANFCKAALLMQLIVIVLYIFLAVIIFSNVFYYMF